MNDPRPIRLVKRPDRLPRQTIPPRQVRRSRRHRVFSFPEVWIIVAIVSAAWINAFLIWRSL